MQILVAAVVLAQDRVPPKGIGGDGQAFGTVELLALALFVGGVAGLVVRAGRRR